MEQKTHTSKAPTAKNPYVKMSLRWYVLRQSVLKVKCLSGEMSSRRNVLRTIAYSIFCVFSCHPRKLVKPSMSSAVCLVCMEEWSGPHIEPSLSLYLHPHRNHYAHPHLNPHPRFTFTLTVTITLILTLTLTLALPSPSAWPLRSSSP